MLLVLPVCIVHTQVLEAAYASGQARAVGVSNFHERQLQHLLQQRPAVRPMVNQARGASWHACMHAHVRRAGLC